MRDLSQVYLKHLIDCTHRQCGKTKEHIDLYRHCFSNNRNSAGISETLKELVFTIGTEHAEGAYFTSLDGVRYLDITMGFGVHLFGHKAGFLDQALQQQLKKGMALGPLYQDAAEVAQLVHEMTGVERCAFYNSGTEAVMVAMRIAKAATGKNKVVIFGGAYHGTHDSLLAIKSDPISRKAISTIPGISPHFTEGTILLEFGTEASLEFIQAHAHEIAAVLTEPVQSRHPESYHPGFLVRLQEITAAADIVLILDEIITGFRVANGGAASLFNIKPDLTTFGKVAGGGMPLGIVGGKKALMDFIDGGRWQFGDLSLPGSPTTFVAGTFCHHPLAMAAAKATLLYLKEREGKVQESLNASTALFCNELNAWFSERGYAISLVSFGSLFRFQLKGKAKLLYYALLKEGVYIWEGRNCFFSTEHREEEIGLLSQKIKKAAIELAASNCLKKPVRANGTEHSSYVQGAAALDSLLQSDHIELASRYLFEAVPALIHTDASVRIIHLSADEEVNSWMAAHPSEQSFCVTVLQKEGGSVLHLRASKAVCDGWSLILFFRELAKCYSALEQQISLPTVQLEDDRPFKQWLSGDRLAPCMPKRPVAEYMEAGFVQEKIDVKDTGNQLNASMFIRLLRAFKNAVGCKEQELAVPVAGQIVSRLTRVFGPCSTQIPLSALPMPEEAGSFLEGLRDSGTFKRGFLAGYKPLPFVFNYDDLNWQLDFAGVNADFFSIHEQQTAHQLVCNVSHLGDQLVVSLKFATRTYTKEQALALLRSIRHHIEAGCLI